MKRSCNEQEKQQIYNNRKNICTGMFYKTAGIGYVTLMLSILVWMVILFGTMPLTIPLFNKLFFYLWMMLLLVVSRVIVGVISIKVKVAKEKKRFLNAANITVNGATIVRISDGYIYYIEDSEKNDSGFPYIIKYAATMQDVSGLNPWDRIVALYGTTADNNAVQLMKLTPEMRYIIPEYSDIDLTRYDMNTLEVYPHPSCRNISKYAKRLNQEEKNRLMNSSSFSHEHANAKKILIVCAVVLFACINILVAGLTYESGANLATKIGSFCLGNAGVILFMVLMVYLRAKNEKKMFAIDVVTEAVYIGSTMGSSYTQIATVYEWKDGRLQEVDYTNCLLAKVKPGDVLYKYNIGKRTVFCKKV